ncbi:MAG TPA: dienelactone hydrolase family protein [Euzebyales bacterium]
MGAVIRLDERHARAYVAEPDGTVRARVLVCHDAYGLLPHVRFLCDELAAHGHVAVAPDLFAGASTRSDAEASRLLETLTAARATRVLMAAVTAFDTLGHRRGPAVLVGFSTGAEFGFGLVAGGHVDATVAYYALPSDDERHAIDAALLLHLAEHDGWDGEEPQRLVADLRDRNVDVVAHHYPGTRHGFSNADIAVFDVEAAERAWQRSLHFIDDQVSAA